MSHSGYLQLPMRSMNRLIDDAREELESVDYGGFIGTGLSGCLVIPTLAHLFGKRFAILRKADENTHSYYPLEHNLEQADRLLFLDDFVASGATKHTIDTAIRDHNQRYGRDLSIIGEYLYVHGIVTHYTRDVR